MADGAATSIAQDLFNGRPPSFNRAREAAQTGGVLGTIAGVAGRRWSDGLSNAVKEDLGEGFSRLRTAARGDTTAPGGKTREYLSDGGYTYPDQRSFRGTQPSQLVESKFGISAALSKRQKQAYRELPNYRVDATLPKDVGAVAGLLTAMPWVSLGLQNPRRPSDQARWNLN